MAAFFHPFTCALHFKNFGVSFKIMLGCCVMLFRVVTFAVGLSHAPCYCLSSAERLRRVENLMKRIMLALSASFVD